MLVEMLLTAMGPDVSLQSGKVYNLPEKQAMEYINANPPAAKRVTKEAILEQKRKVMVAQQPDPQDDLKGLPATPENVAKLNTGEDYEDPTVDPKDITDEDPAPVKPPVPKSKTPISHPAPHMTKGK